MIDKIKKYVLQNGEKFRLSGGELTWLIENTAKSAIIYLFSNGEKYPFLIAKVARSREFAENLEKEFINILEVKRSLPEIGNSIPSAYCVDSIGPYRVLFQKCARGETMTSQIHYGGMFTRKIVKVHFDLALKWLVKFHKLSEYRRQELKRDLFSDSFLEEVCVKNRESITKGIEKMLKEIEGLTIPVSDRHGDFNPKNIILNQCHFSVIDWEFYVHRSPVYYDVFSFLFTYTSDLWKAKKNYGVFDSIYCSFFNKNWYNGLINKFIKDYCKEMKIGQRVMNILFYFFWMQATLGKNSIYIEHEMRRNWRGLEELLLSDAPLFL